MLDARGNGLCERIDDGFSRRCPSWRCRWYYLAWVLSDESPLWRETHFQEIVFDTIIARNIRLSEAPSFGLPALMFDGESKGAINYMNLAREILQKNGLTLTSLKDQQHSNN